LFAQLKSPIPNQCIAFLYKSPKHNNQSISYRFDNFFEIIGDFNVHWEEENSKKRQVSGFFAVKGYLQVIAGPPTNDGTTIDLI
jgi:hypothetical protein